MNRRVFSFIMVMIMVCAMAAGCGKKEEATEKKEEPKQQETQKDDAEEAADEKAEELAVEAKDTNKTELDNADVEALRTSIADSIKKEYLEPNKIAAEDFSWPEMSESVAWEYFSGLKRKYAESEFDIVFGLEDPTVPSGADKQIIEALYNGIINWYETSGVDNYDYFNSALDATLPEELQKIEIK